MTDAELKISRALQQTEAAGRQEALAHHKYSVNVQNLIKRPVARTKAVKALIEFIKESHAGFEHGLDAIGREKFPLHGVRSDFVLTIQASDAFATFYFDSDVSAEALSGHHFRDYSAHGDLNTFFQSAHVNRIKIYKPPIGDAYDLANIIRSPDVEVPAIFKHYPAFFVSPPLREYLKKHKLSHLQCMIVTPHVQTDAQNVVVEYLPFRNTIFCPTRVLPNGNCIRLFHWTRCEIWWQPEKLDLSKENAAITARADLLAMRQILENQVDLPVEKASSDSTQSAADALDAMCDEFQRLVDERGDLEAPMHEWLDNPRHHLFLDPEAVDVRSKVDLYSQVTDFVFRRFDGSYVLVEIEAPARKIFKTSEPWDTTAHFNHAKGQIEGWKHYIREQLDHVRRIQGLEGISQPTGMVVIGRTRDIVDKLSKQRWDDLKGNTERMQYFTYDELIQRIRALAQSMRRILRPGG